MLLKVWFLLNFRNANHALGQPCTNLKNNPTKKGKKLKSQPTNTETTCTKTLVKIRFIKLRKTLLGGHLGITFIVLERKFYSIFAQIFKCKSSIRAHNYDLPVRILRSFSWKKRNCHEIIIPRQVPENSNSTQKITNAERVKVKNKKIKPKTKYQTEQSDPLRFEGSKGLWEWAVLVETTPFWPFWEECFPEK